MVSFKKSKNKYIYGGGGSFQQNPYAQAAIQVAHFEIDFRYN